MNKAGDSNDIIGTTGTRSVRDARGYTPLFKKNGKNSARRRGRNCGKQLLIDKAGGAHKRDEGNARVKRPFEKYALGTEEGRPGGKRNRLDQSRGANIR